MGGRRALGLNPPLLPADPARILGAGTLESRVAGVRAVGVFAQAAGPRAEDLALLGQEGLPQQGLAAAGAAEAGVSGMPVLAFVGHLALVDAWMGGTRQDIQESPGQCLEGRKKPRRS